MDDIYDNLENYQDVNKIDEINLENKELKNKIEKYTAMIDKLQRDFDNLAAEHKKLELNYSSLLKTARSEIERKTQMIKDLNIQKDQLVINARQNMIKSNYSRYKRNENIKSKNNKSSDSNVRDQSDGVIPKIHDSKSYCKSDNVSSAHSFINTKSDTNITSNMGKNDLNKNNIQGTQHCVSKENDMQVLNKLDSRHSETSLKKISNRRKSMPVLSSNEIKFSSDEDCENSVESEVNKKNYQTKEDTIKRFVGKNYNGNRMSETSSIENYSWYHETFTDNHNKNRKNDNRSRDRYESSHRKREKYSPERSYQRVANNYGDDYYQRHDYGGRRAYESRSYEKSYHDNRSRDRRCNYDRDRSRDCIRNRNDDERYAEKHKLLDDFDEPSSKRQKFDQGYRYSQDYKDYNRWQKEPDYSKRTAHSPLELRDLKQLSCQSPDHVNPDYFMPTDDPIKEIKYTANVPLEDPRLTSKKYKTVCCSDKEFITTVVGRNVDILPVNKTVWGFVPVPMPQLLLEPPQSFSENLFKNVNFKNNNPPSHNLRKKSPPLQKKVNRSDDPEKDNVISVENRSLLKCSKKIAENNTFLNENSLCKDDKQNKQTIKDTNSDLEMSLRGECINTKRDDIIGTCMDIIVKDTMCNSIKNMDVVKEILKETSKNNSTQELNSLPNLIPVSLKEKNNIDEEMKHSEVSLRNKINNTKSEKVIGQPIDRIVKGNGSKNSNMDMVKEIKSTSKEILKGSLNKHLAQDYSIPKLNLNPASSKGENNLNKEMTQNNNNVESNEVNEEDKPYDLYVMTNIVEDDLILSDETNDAFDINLKSPKNDTKAKSKKKKELKSYNKNESDIVSKAEDCADKKNKQANRDKETSPEQTKRHKKKILENKGSDSNRSKTIKTRRNKEEKDTKTQEMKSKFCVLFGDSNSLITPDELGVETTENEVNNEYDTIFEDTQAAVDLNFKEIEKKQTSAIDCEDALNDSVNKKIFVEINFSEAIPDCAISKDNNYEKNEEIESNKKIINDNEVKEAKLSMVKDTLSLPNTNGNINSESPDVVKTVIISTGMQPQNNIGDLIEPKNVVRSTEKPIKSVSLHALATSTPAKTYTDNTALEPVFSKTQDCSSNTSPTNSKVVSTPIDESSGTYVDSQKSEDAPDVRIFVKRRRKVKK